MKKNVKKIVILGSTAVGLAAVGASVAGGVIAVNSARATQQVNQFSAKPASLWSAAKGAEDVNESTTTNVGTSNTQVGSTSSTTTGSNTNQTQTSTNSDVTSDDQQFGKSVMTINNTDVTSSLGKMSFSINNVEENVSEIYVSEGDTIVFNVNANEGYTLGDLRVYSTGDINSSLGVTKISETQYSVTMPPKTIDGKTNPFYSTGEIKVTPIFTKKNINFWSYEFESRSYVINVKKDKGIYDEKVNSELIMEGNSNRSIQYRIYLNGHDLQIRNITIPAGAQLMFLNNIKNDNSGGTPTVSLGSNTWLTKTDNGDQIDVKGAIGRFSSVNYGSRMKDYFEPGLR